MREPRKALLRNAGPLRRSEETEEHPAEVGAEASILSWYLPVQLSRSRFSQFRPIILGLDALGNFFEHARR